MDKLVDGGKHATSLIEYLNALLVWEPKLLDESTFTTSSSDTSLFGSKSQGGHAASSVGGASTGPEELRGATLMTQSAFYHFSYADNSTWLQEYLQEIGDTLDSLILLSYSRHVFDLSEFRALLEGCVASPVYRTTRREGWVGGHQNASGLNQAMQTLLLALPMYPLPMSISDAISRQLRAVQFKYIILFAGSLQFWRIFRSDQELKSEREQFSGALEEHPFLASLTTTSTTDTISTSSTFASTTPSPNLSLQSLETETDLVAISKFLTMHLASGSGGSQCQDPFLQLLYYLWTNFLQSFVQPKVMLFAQ
jgi:hypothetical protein